MNLIRFFPQKQAGRACRCGLSLASVFLLLGAPACGGAGLVNAWGSNDFQQSQVPGGLGSVAAVACGGFHCLALKIDGTVVSWGLDLDGQADVPTGLAAVVAIAAGSNYSLALRADGTLQAWGSLVEPPVGTSNVIAIAAGAVHALALRSDRTVVSWGNQTNVPAAVTNAVAISAGNGQSLALRGDGSVIAWGNDAFGQAEVPAWVTNAIAISAGGDHCLALKKDGTVIAWGRNDSGQANVPTSLTSVVAISAGARHSVALKSDGSIFSWGADNAGQASATPPGTGYVGIAADGDHSLAVQGDGQPVIILQPLSQTVTHLQNATFTALALGASPLNYQWQKTGTNLAGATSSVLVVPAVQPFNQGTYTVVVTNSFGSTTSLPAVLTIGGLTPQITSAFQDTTIHCGDSVAFQVEAKGPSPALRLYYQWRFNGEPINDATNPSLVLTNATTSSAGLYSVLVTNIFGSASASAVLSVAIEPAQITSSLTAAATQGAPFSYTIQATHSPASFAAVDLPTGLSLDPASGVISGTPLESGTFDPIISVINSCTSGGATLILNVASAAPVMRTPLTAGGTEGVALQYQIVTSGANRSFAAQNLPPGLTVDPQTGLISGTPVLAGNYYSTVSVSNTWGADRAIVVFTIVNRPIAGLSIGNVDYNYSSPYLLDFSFSLLDDNDPTVGNGIVADPSLLSVTCFEDGTEISASETGAFISGANSSVRAKVIKAYVVLDFTESIASLANGDSNQDGISDAVDSMVNGAVAFVNQQSVDTQIGVFEFHREDMAPSNVVALTSDKALVNRAIAGIWTNNVRGFPAGSRCWDALTGAISALGQPNRDEEHYLVLVSDGRDESSTATLTNVIAAAVNANIQVFSVGFGSELDAGTLQNLSAQTQGRYYAAQNPADIGTQLAQISKMARGQYVLRWATLKRSSVPFMPSFQISYQGLMANSPTNPYTLGDTNVDTTTDPPVTNITPAITNFIIGYFSSVSNAGPVLVGSLRLVPNAEIQPTAVDLRATYIPRYISQLRIHYRANWPCTPTLQSTGSGELLSGWGMTQTNDGAGGNWLLLSSAGQTTNSLPFASFGKLISFVFEDPINPGNAFSVLEVDNTLYPKASGQSFTFENTNAYLSFFPALPHGTPIPWLMSFGFSGDFTNAENLDPDQDGQANWQEFRSNTNPTNAASVFMLQSVLRLLDGRYQLTFDTSTNRSYRVDASTDLIRWRTVQDSIPGTNQRVTLVDPSYIPNLTNVFYRVMVY